MSKSTRKPGPSRRIGVLITLIAGLVGACDCSDGAKMGDVDGGGTADAGGDAGQVATGLPIGSACTADDQ